MEGEVKKRREMEEVVKKNLGKCGGEEEDGHRGGRRTVNGDKIVSARIKKLRVLRGRKSMA